MWAKDSQSHSLYRPRTHLPEGTEGTAAEVSGNPMNDMNTMLEEEKKSDVSGTPNINGVQDNNPNLCNAATSHKPPTTRKDEEGSHGMSPVTLNRVQRTWLLPDKTGKFMQYSGGQEVWVRAERMAVNLRSAKKAELISKSRSKIRAPHGSAM